MRDIKKFVFERMVLEELASNSSGIREFAQVRKYAYDLAHAYAQARQCQVDDSQIASVVCRKFADVTDRNRIFRIQAAIFDVAAKEMLSDDLEKRDRTWFEVAFGLPHTLEDWETEPDLKLLSQTLRSMNESERSAFESRLTSIPKEQPKVSMATLKKLTGASAELQIFLKVREIVSDRLCVDEERITSGSSLATDLGGDYMDEIELVCALEEEFNIELNWPDDIYLGRGEEPLPVSLNNTDNRAHVSFLRMLGSISAASCTSQSRNESCVDCSVQEIADSVYQKLQNEGKLAEYLDQKENESNEQVEPTLPIDVPRPVQPARPPQPQTLPYRTLTANIRRIQCRAAQLEFMEFCLAMNDPSFEVTHIQNIVFSIRSQLHEASEACLSCPEIDIYKHLPKLKDVALGSNSLLLKWADGISADDKGGRLMREFLITLTQEILEVIAALP